MARRHGRIALGLGLIAAVAGCATTGSDFPIRTTAPNGLPDRIPATVDRPAGPGPFPAIVVLHDCSGVGPQSSGAPARWSRELVAHGYVVVIPDSFTTRGHPDGVCTDASPTRAEVSPSRRVYDVYAALAYARTLPFVDGRRVGLMGGSHGGTTTLQAMLAPASAGEPLATARQGGFLGAVALYPSCRVTLGDWHGDGSGAYRPVAPVLILVGDKDDWTPAEPCRRLAISAPPSGPPVMIRIYPGAHHAFDSDRPVRYVAARVNSSAPTGRGATTGGDPQAWADSITQVTEFFGRYIK